MKKNESSSHPSGISQVVVDKVVERRGRLHAFETLDPERTALVVVDLDSRTMDQSYNGRLRAFAPKVNAVADALRARVPLLACPAVLSQPRHCWTSQQWHTNAKR